MSRPTEQAMATVLPALELVTAYTQAGDDPAFFWDAMRRVTADSDDPSRAVAELIFGLSALGGILLDRLADTEGRPAADVLADLHREYLTA